MARYYFDTDDGEQAIRDVSGIDLDNNDDVEVTMRDLLIDLAHSEISSGCVRTITAEVRDDQGVTICRGSLVLRVDCVERT